MMSDRLTIEHLDGAILPLPLWQNGASGLYDRPGADTPIDLPAAVDVLVIGAGYTGLSAARETAAAGCRTLVLDRGAPGAGCSGRNGGQVAYSIKPSYGKLKARFGEARAFAICRIGLDAVEYLRTLAVDEGVDCAWQDCGSFVGAHSRRHFEQLARDAQNQPADLLQRVSIVSRSSQRREIASDFYHGGCVYHDDASVDPMRLLRALRKRAQESGASVLDDCAVTKMTRSAGGFAVETSRGMVRAGKVLIATNGYSGALSPWHRRRVIPIGSYQIATVPLGVERVRSLIPAGRIISDTRRIVVYYRPSVDGERIVFGGRAALFETDPLACVAALRRMLTHIFPELGATAISHAWAGWVAYTFDTLPHTGEMNGLFYCMGYCGQGVSMAPYLGSRVGQRMAGLAQGRTALDDLPFASRPFYSGTPWFLAPSVFVYRTLDALGL